MNAQAVIAKIRGLEEELKVLRSQITENGGKKAAGFSALEGVWRGKVNLSLEEIQAEEIYEAIEN